MGKKRLHAIVHGRVQGVFFREYTRRKAEELGLDGWVRNLPDGTVETVVEGDESMVDIMRQWLYEGSPHSSVTAVDYREEEPEGELRGFAIRY
ncbi:MAG: acylphosphatase [Desulfobulbaceae bacterium]